MLTPQFITRTILAGASARIRAYGRHILVVGISASTVQLSIDDDSPQQITARQHIDCEGRRYSSIILTNAGAAPSTVSVIVSETMVEIQGDDSLLPGIAASLVSIDQEISGSAAAAVAGQLADTVCAVTPGPATLLFAAKASRTEIEIHAPRTNGAGVIYLGITAARAKLVDKFEVLSAGESWYSDREKGAIYASSSTGAEICNGREC
jgi:hypothetical protein